MDLFSNDGRKTLHRLAPGVALTKLAPLFTNTCADFDMPIALSQFGFLEIRGVDAEKFLQGYCTCDLDRLKSGHPVYGALTNIQGRVEATFAAQRLTDALESREDPGLILRLHRSLVAPILAQLQKYIVFSKAQLIDRTDDIHCYGFEGESSLPQQAQSIDPSSHRRELWSREIIQSDESETDWIARDLLAGRIWISNEASGLYLPQELGMDHAGGIDFDKGCYLGQEIIARLHFKGQTKQTLTLYKIPQAVDFETETPITNTEGTAVGHVLQCAWSEHGRLVAALIQRSAMDAELRIGDTALQRLS